MKSEERRLSTRRKIQIPLKVESVDDDGAPTQIVDSEDLSARGAYFVSRVSFQVGERLKIGLRMPEELFQRASGEWNCLARIVYVRPIKRGACGFGTGVHFLCYERISGRGQEEPDSTSGTLDESRTANLSGFTHRLFRVERRSFPRAGLRSKVEVSAADVDLEGETVDVSVEGLLVRTGRIFVPGTQVRVRVSPSSGGSPILANGAVVRIDEKDQMGIRLEGFEVDGEKQLEELLLGVARAS